MAYTKLTARRWVQLLRDKTYKSASAAKKGIGRIDWTKEAKDVARSIIDGHYAGKKITESDIKALEALVPEEEETEKRTPRTNGKARRPVTAMPLLPTMPFSKDSADLLDLKTSIEAASKLVSAYGEVYEMLSSVEDNGGDGSERERVAGSASATITILDRLTGKLLKSSEKFVGEPPETVALFDKAQPKAPFKPSQN